MGAAEPTGVAGDGRMDEKCVHTCVWMEVCMMCHCLTSYVVTSLAPEELLCIRISTRLETFDLEEYRNTDVQGLCMLMCMCTVPAQSCWGPGTKTRTGVPPVLPSGESGPTVATSTQSEPGQGSPLMAIGPASG